MGQKPWWQRRFTKFCPNCESAWTGGCANPEDIKFCVVCSDPRTGEVRYWVWRWQWFHTKFVSRSNMDFYARLNNVIKSA